MRISFIALALIIGGCGSTPYKDDYTKHVNLIKRNYFNDKNFKYVFPGEDKVDLRGLYSQNDTVNATPILYQGAAGVVGLIAQIGTHSALINSQRNSQLELLQNNANEKIFPLREMAQKISLNELTSSYRSALIKKNGIRDNAEAIHIKPIFFSNQDMTEVSLKSVVWLPNNKAKRSTKHKSKYQNMIQVYGHKLTQNQKEQILAGNQTLLNEVLASLLNTSIHIIKSELTGKYAKHVNKPQTFILESNEQNKVVRGTLIAEKCNYKIIQDLHSWFIAYPKKNLITQNTNNENNKCII